MKARSSKAKRQNRERAEIVEVAMPDRPSESQITEILDEEIRRLPRQYGSAVVLCCLQEASLEEAARQLGVTEGSIRARLWRGREMLRKRLAARGVTLPAVAVGAWSIAPNSLLATVPTGLQSIVPGLAVQFVTASVPTTYSTFLAQGVLQAMLIQKMKLLVAVGLSVLLLVGGAGFWLTTAEAKRTEIEPIRVAKMDPRDLPKLKPAKKLVHHRLEDGQKEKEPRVELEVTFLNVDPTKRTITIEGEVDDQKRTITFVVAKDAEILIAQQKLDLKELQPNMFGSISYLEKDKETIVAIHAKWPTITAKLASVDKAKNTITVRLETKNGIEVDQSYPVVKDARVIVDGMISGLDDLEPLQEVEVEFSLDKKSLVRLESQGNPDDVHGKFKSFDAAKGVLLVTLEINGLRSEKKVDLAFEVIKDAAVRYQGKETTLAEVKVGMPVRMKLKADRRTVTHLWAVDPVKEGEDD